MKFRRLAFCFACWAIAVPRLFGAEIAPLRFPVKCGKPDAFIPYAATQPVDRPNSKITRIIVGIHSSGFNATQCLNGLRQAASKVPGARETTLIVAPQFLGVGAVNGRIPDRMIAWKVSPYRGSSLASYGPEKEDTVLSAYQVMNQLLEDIVDIGRFPNLKHAVVCGHSSGGQMAQRYGIVGAYAPRNGVMLRYVPSAPSSFAYLDEKRPKPGARIRFVALEGAALEKYPHYNKWGYGLDNLYRAFRGGKPEYFRKRYATRRVLYLIGGQDNDPNDRSMSTNSGAMLQGRHRLERTQLFYKHLLYVYGEDIQKTHVMAIAPGVTHDEFKAYSSPAALKFLFDKSSADSDGDGTTDWEEWLEGR